MMDRGPMRPMSERRSGCAAVVATMLRIGVAVVAVLGVTLMVDGIGAQAASAFSPVQVDDGDTVDTPEEEPDPEAPDTTEKPEDVEDVEDTEGTDDESTEVEDPSLEPDDVPVIVWVGAGGLVLLALVWAVGLAGGD